MQNKHIMVISDHADPLASIGGLETGGQNIYVLQLAKSLPKFGWRLDIFTRWDNPHKKQIKRIGCKARVIRIKAGPIKRIPRDQIAQHLAEFSENIIEFKSRENIDYCLIHANYWMSGWIGLRLKAIYNLPLIQIFHSLGRIKYQTLKEVDAQRHSSGFFDSAFMKQRLKVEKTLFENADTILASSPREKQDMMHLYQAKSSKIKLLPLGVNPQVFRPIAKDKAYRYTGWSDKQNIILYVGRIEWRKGVGTLLYALKDLLDKQHFKPSQLALKIIGGHPRTRIRSPEYYEFKRLKGIVDELGIGSYVSFLGSLKREKLLYYYSAADLVVMPSYYEPFGLVPVEAMACGAPVIGSRVGGIQFTIHNKQTGFLVPARRYRALANQILVLLNNPCLREKMGRAGVLRVKKQFNNHLLSRQMNHLFKTLITRQSS